MASKYQVESWTEEAVCSICLDFFTDPVTLECGHNFCRSCITQSWDRERRNSCPECREEFVDRTLRVNRALVRLAEKARALSLHLKEKESKLHCEKHQEELKLFCETDKTLICLICATAREHKTHSFMPVDEAIVLYKEQAKSSFESLTERKSEIEQMEQEQKESISGVQAESQNLQSLITSQFAELHQIFTEKEQRFLGDIREEEKKIVNRMKKNLQEIQDNLISIQEELSKLQEQIDQKDGGIFLKGEAGRDSSASVDAESLSVTDAAPAFESFYRPFMFTTMIRETTDAIKRSSLQTDVANAAAGKVHFPQAAGDGRSLNTTDRRPPPSVSPPQENTSTSPGPSCPPWLDSVTLDVETAHALLEVSEDRKSVKGTWNNWRRLPDTGKRFTAGQCVLGSEGFTSGRHYWEVEVAENQYWSLGVAAESVERKGRVPPSPETGVWSIARQGGVSNANTSPPSHLTDRPIPGRVGVYLSYESGTVSFYDADTKSHLHTFTGNKFTEKLYPLFETNDGNWLRICSGSAPGV